MTVDGGRMVTELVTPNLDANTFELKGPWEQDRGPQQLAYDLWWHLGHDTMISSEWGTPNLDE